MTLIIGGGITGLSLAFFLKKNGEDVTVLDANKKAGGVMQSDHLEGTLFDRGPNTLMQKKGRAEDALGVLLGDLGLKDEILLPEKAATKRYILRDNHLRPLPDSPPAFLTTDLFSLKAKLRLSLEPFIRRSARDTEETIAQFVKRRLGQEFLDYSIAPFIAGVYAGDTEQLSVQAAVPRIYALEQEYGSLIRAALARGKIGKGTGSPAGRQISFQDGLSYLPHRIAERLGESFLPEHRVSDIEKTPDGFRVTADHRGEKKIYDTKRLALALPADRTADLIASLLPKAADILREIPYVPIMSAAICLPRAAVSHPLDGYGALFPPIEKEALLGVLFSNSLYPGRAPKDQVLLTAYLGGALRPDLINRPDEALKEIITDTLTRHLGLTAPPSFIELTRYNKGLPQYTLGHLKRIKALTHAETLPNLQLTGNWRHGISVSDCILNARKLAEKLERS